ncbi:MAG: MCE family protein [Rikenellaceae bacterium]|nr:MCE family protein [Rikenellaceae bacterium]
MKKEVKIGIFAVVMLLALWAGIRFLSGIDIFSRNIIYYASYENVSGLQTAAPITIHGVKVGTIESITFDPSKGSDVEVALAVKRQYRLPVDTRAVIYDNGIMGGKAIKLDLGSSSELLKRGDQIISDAGSDMMSSIGNELGDLKGKLTVVADNLATALANINTLVEQNTDNLSGTISNLNSISSSLDGVLKSERKNIEGIVTSLNGLAEMLDQNTERFDRIIGNVDAVAEQLEQAKVDSLVQAFTSTADNLSRMLASINAGEGTVGELMNDKELYDNLAAASGNLSALLADLKEHPARYVHISVFGSDPDKKAERKAARAEKKAAKAAQQAE